MVAFFGDEILKSGEIDRRALGEIVFKDAEKRKKLESIIHPIVQANFNSAKKSLTDEDILIYEIPLLVETDAAKKFDLIITVEASQEQRENRLLARGLLASEIKARMASQVDDLKLREIADLVIENTGDLAELSASVEKIWENELLPRK